MSPDGLGIRAPTVDDIHLALPIINRNIPAEALVLESQSPV